MAACASGARIASTVMCSAMIPCSGCSACTVTSTAGAASFLQPGRENSATAMARGVAKRTAKGRLVAQAAVLAGIFGIHECGLGIDYFEHGGFTACVAHPGQP